MKNTMIIRSLMLAGLVLGSSFAQANWGRSVAKVAQKSFLSQHKLALGLGVAGVALTAGVIASIVDFVKSDDYTNCKNGKLDTLKTYFTRLPGRAKVLGTNSWEKTKNGADVTWTAAKKGARWVGYQVTFHKYFKPEAAAAAPAPGAHA